MTDFRALCVELTDCLEKADWPHRYKVVFQQWTDIARAALAQPGAEVVGPSDDELRELAAAEMDNAPNWEEPECSYEVGDPFPYEAPGVAWVNFARAVLARFGNHFPDTKKMVSPAPAPAEGEVGELVEWLRLNAEEYARDGCPNSAEHFTRAADLLERQAALVPVSERLPGALDCDAEGRCWWGLEESDDYEACWTLRKMHGIPFDDTHWLPATALPLPQGEVE